METEYRLYFALDPQGHPVWSALYCTPSDGLAVQLDCQEFGPFHTQVELLRWALRALEGTRRYNRV